MHEYKNKINIVCYDIGRNLYNFFKQYRREFIIKNFKQAHTFNTLF